MRATGPADDLSLENPLLIDPMQDNPLDHIEFREELAVARERSAKGEATIDVAGLNRPDLLEMRRRIWRFIRELIQARVDLQDKGISTHGLEELLLDSLKPESEYSAMSRDLIARLAPELLPP